MIDDSQSLQYRIELAEADMVDIDPSSLRSTRERLTDLRVHQDAFMSSEMCFHSFDSQDGLIRVQPASGGVIPYSAGPSLKLFRPPSASRRVSSRVWSFDGLPVPLGSVSGYQVDISQGLLLLFSAVPNQK